VVCTARHRGGSSSSPASRRRAGAGLRAPRRGPRTRSPTSAPKPVARASGAAQLWPGDHQLFHTVCAVGAILGGLMGAGSIVCAHAEVNASAIPPSCSCRRRDRMPVSLAAAPEFHDDHPSRCRRRGVAGHREYTRRLVALADRARGRYRRLSGSSWPHCIAAIAWAHPALVAAFGYISLVGSCVPSQAVGDRMGPIRRAPVAG